MRFAELMAYLVYCTILTNSHDPILMTFMMSSPMLVECPDGVGNRKAEPANLISTVQSTPSPYQNPSRIPHHLSPPSTTRSCHIPHSNGGDRDLEPIRPVLVPFVSKRASVASFDHKVRVGPDGEDVCIALSPLRSPCDMLPSATSPLVKESDAQQM